MGTRVLYINVAAGIYEEAVELGSFSVTTGHITIRGTSVQSDVVIKAQNSAAITVRANGWYLLSLTLENEVIDTGEASAFRSALQINNKSTCFMFGCKIRVYYNGDTPSGSLEIRGITVSNGSTLTVDITNSTHEHMYIDVQKGNASSARGIICERKSELFLASTTQADTTKYIIYVNGVYTDFFRGQSQSSCNVNRGNANYMRFAIKDGDSVTGKRYALLQGSNVVTNGLGPEYFPGDQEGSLDTATHCFYS